MWDPRSSPAFPDTIPEAPFHLSTDPHRILGTLSVVWESVTERKFLKL